MKILIFNWKDIKDPDVGGAEIISFELAKRLIRDGHSVVWFCRQFKGCLPQEDIDGISVIRRGNRFTTYFHAVNYYSHLKAKPDIVIDMINTLCWQTPLFVKCKRFAYLNQLAQEVFFYEWPIIISHLAYCFESLQYLTYKKTNFITYSNSTKDDLVKIGIPAQNIQMFKLGLDHDRYFPAKKSEVPLFIYVGRLNRMKRVDLCIEAMAHLVKEHPEAKLAIIGYGYYKTPLEKMVKSLNLEDNVYFEDKDVLFFEKFKGDKKVSLMQQAWALLIPSVKEGWGLVVIEANACGTPAIATDVTGLRDSVIRNETGIIVSRNPSPVEIAEAMARIIEDEDLRNRLSQNSSRWAREFSWEGAYQGFKKIILED